MKYLSNYNNFYIKFAIYFVNIAIFVIVVFSTLILFSNTTNASLYSFLKIGQEVSANNKQFLAKSSQTMPLPIVAVNIDPNPDKGLEIIPVADGKTLISDLANANTVNEEYSSKISVYVVRDGDTISDVAKMFNVSVNTILWANNMNSKSVLKVGQILNILPVTGIKYTVQKNETIASIAKKYNADITEILSYNDLDEKAQLKIGQVIIIPDAEMGIASSVSTVKALNGMIVPEDPVIVNVRKLPLIENYYSCPVVGRLSQGLHGRNSVDLAAPVGTPIFASASGLVTISKSNETWNGGYGNFVVISHSNGTQTLYAHMQKTIVEPNDKVNKGQIIGYVGISGLTTGPHVHFEVRGAKNPFVNLSCN